MTSFIVPDWDIPLIVGALSTTRHGGVSLAPYDDGIIGGMGGGLNLGSHVGDREQDVEHNRNLLRGVVSARPIWLSQIHGTTVVDAGTVPPNTQADASIAVKGGVACAILTADCLPVLLCDQAGQVVGAAHAGWRGLAAGVLENTVLRMQQAGAGEIIAWLGPAIGPACFEVGAEVQAAFVARQAQASGAFQAIAGRPGKFLADIYLLARLRLESVGVTRVSGGGCCTVTDRRFYSYRRDKVTGRMASLIWIKD